ncbi:MAG: hypothetical protein KDK39_13325, partial [Leptospiraceae bacterium]|nr:hypothetical protein [Leptospiraceae bacterium]
MRLGKYIKTGSWILILLNLGMAFGSIWIFNRMAPAIAVILEENQRSLHACEKMLASLGRIGENPAHNQQLLFAFQRSFERARNNITEEEENIPLEVIRQNYSSAFGRDVRARALTIDAIVRLADINRQAMNEEDNRAQQLGYAGAWGVVFMAAVVFLVHLIFYRRINRSLINPLEEIKSVIELRRRGDNLRRFSGNNLPQDIRSVYDGL